MAGIVGISEEFIDHNRLRFLKQGKIKFTEIGNIDGKPLLMDSYKSSRALGCKLFDFYFSSCILNTVYCEERNFLDIHFFICDGAQKGDGKKMMCYSLGHLKQRIEGLNDATIVSLTASASQSDNLIHKRPETGESPEEKQLKLEAYYMGVYGFQKSNPEDPRSNKFHSTLGAIIVKCYPPPSGSSRKKTKRRKTKKMSRKV
jgi:hypothetical protein